MHRALGIVALLLAVALVLPTIAAWAQAAVPVLVALLIFLAAVQMLLPPRQGP